MADRHLPARDYLALKAVFHQLVESLGGPCKAAAYTRVSAQMLSNYGNPNVEGFAPIDVAADLESEAGEPCVTRLLADLINADLVTRRGGKVPAETFHRHLGDTSRASAGLTQELASALEDGKVDDRERGGIRRAALASVLEDIELVRDLDVLGA